MGQLVEVITVGLYPKQKAIIDIEAARRGNVTANGVNRSLTVRQIINDWATLAQSKSEGENSGPAV